MHGVFYSFQIKYDDDGGACHQGTFTQQAADTIIPLSGMIPSIGRYAVIGWWWF